jgi:hypothetical protein
MPPAVLSETVTNGSEGLTEAERALLPEGDYFLYPANLWPHKNHRRVLQAFARFLESSGRPLQFLFTGHADGWEALAKDFPGLPIRHLGFVSRRALQALLVRARALIFFSLFEGFGMPLLEAFAAGVPVACSACASLPEVGGDAVLLCDPTDVAAMSAPMARVDRDEELRLRLAARGRERLRYYDWHRSAAELVAACTRVAAGPVSCSEAVLVRAGHRLNGRLQEVEADREARLEAIHRLEKEAAARLEVIHRLDGALRQSEADRAARLEAIHHLQATLARSEEAKQRAEAERDAARAEVARLSRGVFRRIVRRLLGPVKPLLAQALPAAASTSRKEADD